MSDPARELPEYERWVKANKAWETAALRARRTHDPDDIEAKDAARQKAQTAYAAWTTAIWRDKLRRALPFGAVPSGPADDGTWFALGAAGLLAAAAVGVRGGANRGRQAEVGLRFGPDLTDDEMHHLFAAQDELLKAGIMFDTSGGEGTRDWEWDWSLSGPVRVLFRRFRDGGERVSAGQVSASGSANGAVVYLAELDTPHFLFQAVSTTHEGAAQALREAWARHRRQYRRAQPWDAGLEDDVRYTPMRLDTGYRDRERIP
jgi:hypothetical protein